jgi:sensor c-di-GMP phosphodiesterase-like protein
VPFAIVRADYGYLDVSFTVIACLMSGAFLALSLQYVRRSQLPAFDLERAIQAGELKPYYQPVINLKTGALAGCEVLCRWEKRSGVIVPPGAFIEYAEVTGLAIPMTVSLMQQVRSDLAELCREMPEIKVSINLFQGHFRDTSIVEDVGAIFGGSSIAFRQLVFEITERGPLDNTVAANAVISGLHALGCRIAMDDAGTGHSNLAYMQTLGVDVIKIDRVFVDMIKPGTIQVPVLDALIAMARDLGTEIVAEGVETEAQALYLRARGVIMAQGFLFAPAIRLPQFVELARALNAGKERMVNPKRAPAAA